MMVYNSEIDPKWRSLASYAHHIAQDFLLIFPFIFGLFYPINVLGLPNL